MCKSDILVSFQRNISFVFGLVGLLSTKAIEYFFWPPFCNRSIYITGYNASMYDCLGSIDFCHAIICIVALNSSTMIILFKWLFQWHNLKNQILSKMSQTGFSFNPVTPKTLNRVHHFEPLCFGLTIKNLPRHE